MTCKHSLSTSHHCSVACIMPPDMLDNIMRNGDVAQRDEALQLKNQMDSILIDSTKETFQSAEFRHLL